jgi:hypothetical protein
MSQPTGLSGAPLSLAPQLNAGTLIDGETVTRDYILAEIRRTTAENRGVPLGKQRFSALTGVKRHDWFGKYWAKWSDALREAGFTPNIRSAAVPEADLLGHLTLLTRETWAPPG